jgi:PKD repeat protein
MKKILFILYIIFTQVNFATAQNCGCPEEFVILADKYACSEKPGSGPTGGNPDFPQQQCKWYACKNSTNTYSVWPKKPGFTYNWIVVGGTANTLVGNSIKVLWGSGSGPFDIKVFIASTDGKCKDTVTQTLCLLNGPKANYNIDGPTTVCLNTGVNFNNTSIGATTAYWTFGDGTTSTQLNPTHAYSSPGTYQVVLTVTNEKIDTMRNGGATGLDFIDKCGCTDTIVKTIIVKNAEPIKIVEGCKKMLCKGDTAEYCTPTACADYDWSVTGGTILGSSKGKCIKVVWNGSYPATVNLKGNCGATCGNTASLDVPVLFPTMPIGGAIKVCPNTKHIYTLPNMPGVFYTWKITPASGGSFIGPDKNISNVTIDWKNITGTYKVTCDYFNPVTKCSGKAELTVEVLPEYKVMGPDKVCLGDNATYTANGVSTWKIEPALTGLSSSFAPGSSINVVWNKKGTYTLTGTASNPSLFCDAAKFTIKVIVNDTPYVNAINGPILVCPGSTQLYNANSTMVGGNFIWTVTGSSGSIAMGLQQENISIDWAATGPYKIKVQHKVNGCLSSLKEIILNNYQKPKITGPSPACMDNSATYTTTTPAPAGGYTWSLGNALGTITSGNGTNTITVQWHGSTAPPPNICPVYLTTCGGKDTLKVTITQAPLITITKSGTLCSTSGITLSSSIAGASTYVWTYNSTTLAPPKNTQNINVTAAGTYTVTVNNAGGCVSKGTIVVPKETPPFNVGISTTSKTYWKCTETINTIMTATPNITGYCHQWFTKPVGMSGPGSPIFGATAATYTATSVGLFWCEVKLCGTNCSKETNAIKVEKEICDTSGPCTNYTITSFTKTGACNPFTFTVTTSPAAASANVHWYFGDGTDVWGTNSITHLFKTIGTFKVCAVIGVSPYCRKDTCMDVAVNVAANFSMISNCGVITLTNLSQSLSGTPTYTWNATGGTFSPSNTATNPTVTFATGGLQTIELETTLGTCKVKVSDTISTKVLNGTINIPTTICVGTAAPFAVTGTSLGLQYFWNFGDGYTSNLQNTTHAYSTNGLKNVTLIITDPATGCSITLPKTANVITAQPMATIADQKMCMGSSVVLTAPSAVGFTYQWYLEGVAISGANAVTYTTNAVGEYYVELKSSSGGCIINSNKFKVKYFGASVANIIKDDDEYCDKNNIKLSATPGQGKYTWSQLSGPGTITFTPNGTVAAFNTVGTATTEGIYQIILSTENTDGCKGYDTICIEINKAINVSITSPTGTLCEGQIFTFTAVPSPVTSPDIYSYIWSGSSNNTPTFTTGVPGTYQVILVDDKGCFATATTPAIAAFPNVSLFPQGCDTLCLTDTIKFPLPLGNGTNAAGYTITWFDTDGMTITNVGTGFTLDAASLNTGDHHLYAEVVYSGGCKATTASFDVYIKDCTLGPPCNDCPTILDSSAIQMDKELQKGNGFVVKNGTITFTTKVPIKSVKINLSELNYHWNDPTCVNCKVTTINRGCIFPQTNTQTIGTLVLDNYSGASITTASKECPNELVWKSDIELPAGTYTVPFQITLPENTDKRKCQLIFDNLCVQLTLIDKECKSCVTKICHSGADENSDCNCNPGGVWSSLYLVPVKPGIAKPKNLILCGSTLTDYNLNVAYKLSGMYSCQGTSCTANYDIVVQDQQTHIVYTRKTTVLNETITFPGYGYYTVKLTANCGTKKCVCTFKVFVTKKDVEDPPPPIVTGDPKDPPKTDTPIKNAIDSIVTKELPPNFNGGILVSRNDSVLYEKYVNVKDTVNNHTAFDIASITKTFTSMAILKLMETGKLKLEDPVSKYLQGFPKSNITIKMLLTHTSGIEDYLKFMDESTYDKNKIMNNADLYKFILSNPNKVFVKDAGSAFDYSNTNFALLALVIENISSTSYNKYMETTFFKPLKMDDTYILTSDNLQKRKTTYYKSGKAYPLRYLDLINGDKCVHYCTRFTQVG